MSEMEENGRNYVERNLDWSGATSAGRTPELDADFTKDFWLNKETGFRDCPVERRYVALVYDKMGKTAKQIT